MIIENIFLNHNIQKWNGTYKNNEWTLLCGDAAQSLQQLDDQSVHCIITSPPYYSLRDYGETGQIGLEETVDEYIDVLCAVMDKSGGLGINLCRKSIIGIPWRVAIEMTKRNWILRSPIIWHREKALPESVKDRPHRSYEYIFMFAKDRKYYFNRQPFIDKQMDEDVWTIMPRPSGTKINTAPYPDELVSRCLAIGCPNGGTVLDPFVGSGTTMKVSLENGYHAIGIDLSQKFCQYVLKVLEDL